MARKIDVSLLESMLYKGHNYFELTSDEYHRVIGKELPKTNSYITYKSPIAKVAKKAGYKIHIKEIQAVKRIIVFEKIDK